MAASVKRTSWQDYTAATKALASWSTLDKAPFLIFIYGTSEYGLNQASEQVKQLALSSEAPVHALEGAQLADEHVATICEQGSLFEPTSLYLVRRFEQSRQAAKLLAQIPASSNSCSAAGNRLCIISQTSAPLAPIKKELERLKAFMVPCSDPWPNELPAIVENMAARLKLKLDKSAVNLLIETNGSDLIKLDNELKKLVYVFYESRDKETLSAAMISLHLGMLREDDAFQLDQLLLKKDWAKAHTLATNLIERGEKPIALIGILARHCRNAIKVAEARQKGANAVEIANRLRLPQFVTKSYLQYVSKSSLSKFAMTLDECRKADFLLKSSPMDEEILLANIIESLNRP